MRLLKSLVPNIATFLSILHHRLYSSTTTTSSTIRDLFSHSDAMIIYEIRLQLTTTPATQDTILQLMTRRNSALDITHDTAQLAHEPRLQLMTPLPTIHSTQCQHSQHHNPMRQSGRYMSIVNRSEWNNYARIQLTPQPGIDGRPYARNFSICNKMGIQFQLESPSYSTLRQWSGQCAWAETPKS